MACKKIYIGSMNDFDYVKVEHSGNWIRIRYCDTYREAIESLYSIPESGKIKIDESRIHTPFGVYDIILTVNIYE